MNAAALIPAFNEAGSIADVVAGVRAAVSHVIVVDDGSTDGTAERARAAGAEVMAHAVNRGKGEAVRTGLARITAGGFTHVLLLDGDMQHLPAEATRAFPAPAKAYVEVYEVTGEGKARKDENRPRGRLDLENPGAVAEVVLRFEVDENGLLRIVASYPPNEQRELQLKDIGRWTSKEAEVLREKIMSVRLQG